MNLFRSEVIIVLSLVGQKPGSTIPITDLSSFAHSWWSDCLPPDWSPHTREQNMAILERLGLTGEFWRLP